MNSNATHLFLSLFNQGIDPEEEMLQIDLTNTIKKALDTLTEKDIIKLRFGLDDDRDRTLEEIGKVYGVTRERIRQIETKAIGRLKKNKMLKEYVTSSHQ